MSLGVDERSPSSTEASEMTEGWREWPGLNRTAATAAGRQGQERRLCLLWCFVCCFVLTGSSRLIFVGLGEGQSSTWRRGHFDSSAVAKQQCKQLNCGLKCVCIFVCVRVHVCMRV